MTRIGGFANIKRVLGNRNYRIFIGGNLCSNLGNWIQRVAVGWLTWQLTESAAWLGLITFADLFPTVLIGLIAGALVDRTDYLRMLKLTQTIAMTQAALLSLLTFADLITIELLLALTVLRGVNTAFNRPARMSLVYRLVGRDTLSSAIALNAIVFNSARFVGPAAGGAIIVAGGVALAFACNALTFLVFLAALMFVRLPREEKRRKEGRGLLSEAADGVRYTLSHPGIGPLLIILVVTALFARPFTELLPGFADQVFGRGVDGLALLISANGLGAMAAGLWLLQRGAIAGLAAIVIANLLLMACALLAFTATDIFWVAMPFLVVTGFSLVMQGVSVQTLIQTAVAGELRGRVLAVYGIVARGCPAIGALILGGLSEHFDNLRLPVAGGAAVCLVLWVWAARLRPAMARAFEGEPAEARL